jgi:hypothetical protein
MQQNVPSMNSSKKRNSFLKTLLYLGVGMAAWLAHPRSALAANEETFDVLQIGTRTYKNVTVTTKAKNYVFILHSTGMANVKVTDLPPELREKLGYNAIASADEAKRRGASASAWAKKTMASIQVPQIKQLEQALQRHGLAGVVPARLNPTQGMLLVSLVLLFYVAWSYCCFLVCKKAGQQPSAMVWIPLLQLIPLLRAAGMSEWWFVALFVPVINVVGWMMWCFKIAKACGKGAGVGFLLLLPVANFFALLYLAFSGGAAPKKEQRPVEIMSLEVA